MSTAREIMTPGATVLDPANTVVDAAQAMAAQDFGAMPVCDGGRLVGMVTDRDLVVRILGEGLDPRATTIADVMAASA